mmetsp:Transcript_17953/g.36146  ORF Transcript_17953/g.36146 Transcript_17953/m.36146 type:complete len:354 (+) Transcript_17953:479-1540(+)
MLGGLVMVPPLPYLARVQMFMAWYVPVPIWLSSNEVPLYLRPITGSSSWKPPLPYGVHLPHMFSLTPSTWQFASFSWHHPVGHAPALYLLAGANSHLTIPSTRSVSLSPPHLLPFENLFQSNPLCSSAALEQQLALLLSPLRQLPYQCTCFAAPAKLYPPHLSVGGSTMVPPLPYFARMQTFIAWYVPTPIWLSSKDAPLYRKPMACSSSENPALPQALHSPHMLSLTPKLLHVELILWHQPVGHAPAAYAPTGANSQFTVPSTRSVSLSPPHLFPLENLFQSNPLLSTSALVQHAADLVSPLPQFPNQCTCFAAPPKLLPPQFAVGASVIVPPLPYFARMQMFIAWYDPVPI